MNELFAAMFPGMMYFWVFFIGQGPLQEVLNEKQLHTMQRILAAPITLNQFLWSKLIRCFLLSGLIQVLLILLSQVLFHIKWGNPWLLGVVVAFTSLSITGVLACIYSLARTREQGNSISAIILLVFALLGGSMFPFENLPAVLQVLGRVSPNRWGILALQGVMRSKPAIELLQPLLILAAIGVVGIGFSLWLFPRQLESRRGP